MSGSLVWLDDIEGLVPPSSKMKDFVQSLHHYERQVFSFCSPAESLYCLQGLLEIEFSDIQSTSAKETPQRLSNNSQDHMRMCSLFSGYRLAEQYFINITLPPCIPQSSGQQDKGLKGYEHLENWVDMLLTLCNIIKHINDLKLLHTRSGPEQLINHIRDAQRNMKYCKVVINMLVAALHLAFLQSHSFSEGELPDIPDNLDSLDEMSPFKQQFLDLVDNQKHGSSLCSALHLALLILPLYLLVSIQLMKNSFCREQVLQVRTHGVGLSDWLKAPKCTHALGNMKGSVLLRVEGEIMVTAKRLASRNCIPLQELKELFGQRIPWYDVENCDAETRNFFQLSSGANRLGYVKDRANLSDMTASVAPRAEHEEANLAQPEVAMMVVQLRRSDQNQKSVSVNTQSHPEVDTDSEYADTDADTADIDLESDVSTPPPRSRRPPAPKSLTSLATAGAGQNDNMPRKSASNPIDINADPPEVDIDSNVSEMDETGDMAGQDDRSVTPGCDAQNPIDVDTWIKCNPTEWKNTLVGVLAAAVQ
ncbi:unnamed protein product [Cyclocybe aegerita]|uniref:Uncharacterized protein n=1 Tax=Cyclocybe aegerita TaxID=1973307 RepID=A0A8S0WZX2_CYCAE|nr:unnamed protein product [Cyclocybe aegerita]